MLSVKPKGFILKRLCVVEVSGYGLELQAHEIVSKEEYDRWGCEEGWLTSESLFLLDDTVIEVEGKEYKLGKRGGIRTEEAGKHEKLVKSCYKQEDGQEHPFCTYLDVKKFAKEHKADFCEVVYCQSSGRVEIEIPKDEQFDPSKALVLTCDWNLNKYKAKMISLFVYDGKGYIVEEEGFDNEDRELIYGNNPNECEWD